MKGRARGVLVVAALTLGACSGESAAPTTTVPGTTASSSTSPATTAPATISTTAPAATTPPTTAPPTTATTVAPTVAATIPADLAQAQQDVINAAIAGWQAYEDAARDPSNEAKLARLAATLSGPKLQKSIENISALVASGRVVVENPAMPAAVDIYEETVVVDPVALTGSVEFCRIGSDLGIEPGGNPDGTDKVVVNEINSYHERSDLIFVSGTWFDDNGAVLQKFEGSATCGA